MLEDAEQVAAVDFVRRSTTCLAEDEEHGRGYARRSDARALPTGAHGWRTLHACLAARSWTRRGGDALARTWTRGYGLVAFRRVSSLCGIERALIGSALGADARNASARSPSGFTMFLFELFISLVLLALVVFQIWLTVRVFRSSMYEKKQKIWQAQLIWFLPIIGAGLVFSILREDDAAQREASTHLRG
jgi:hypothetical protein